MHFLRKEKQRGIRNRRKDTELIRRAESLEVQR